MDSMAANFESLSLSDEQRTDIEDLFTKVSFDLNFLF